MENINLKIEQFNLNIKNVIQSSDLPIGIIHYVFKNLQDEIEKTYIGTLNQLMMEEQNQNIDKQEEGETE